jgi:predicted GIY-YIG superfamily endonuclease
MNTVAVDKKINKNNYQEYEIKEILKILPKKSGVYIFKNSKGKIIYIGKANNLYSRVKSYFQDRSDNFLYAKPLDFAKRIKSIDYIVTDNETEALILECSLNLGSGPFGRVHNLLSALINKFVVVSPNLDSDFRLGAFFFGRLLHL